jgi:hypothetical protein
MFTQSSSLLNGSTARRLVCKVASSCLDLRGAWAEKAKGPAGMGQYKPELLSGDGRGDEGRRVWQKNESLSKTLNVRISVFKNNVAKIACKLQGDREWGSVTHPGRSYYWRFPGLVEEIDQVR